MTEEDARTKMCPLAAIFLPLQMIAAHAGRANLNHVCIASGCALWRWDKLYSNMPSSGRIVENGRSETDGYCGIGGPP